MVDDILLAKVNDALKISVKRPKFVGFLSESEAAALKPYLKNKDNFLLWGGHEDAERPMIGFFPEYIEADPDLFPISAVCFKFRTADKLGHRDFLGSFMSMGIERDVIGDILIGDGIAVAFVRDELINLFTGITKIGKIGVSVSETLPDELPAAHSYESLAGVVASGRIDCITAILCKTSREKASALITAGAVSINHAECLSASKQVEVNDIIVIRGKGKFIIDEFSAATKKGRLPVKYRKYK